MLAMLKKKLGVLACLYAEKMLGVLQKDARSVTKRCKECYKKMLGVLACLYSEKMLWMLQKDARGVKKCQACYKKILGMFKKDTRVLQKNARGISMSLY